MHNSLDAPHSPSLRPAAAHGSKVSAFILAALCFTPVTSLLCPAQSAPAPSSSQGQPASFPAQGSDLSDEVARDVLTNFQRGIETRNLDRLLGTFDPDSTSNFSQIREQFVVFFQVHNNIKFRYQLQQVAADKEVAYAIADVEMDAQPADILPTEQRRTAQMRFQMKLTPSGWRIIGLKPLDFFTN